MSRDVRSILRNPRPTLPTEERTEPNQINSIQDAEDILFARKNARLVAEQTERMDRQAREQAEALPVEQIEPASLLSNSELQRLDLLQRRQAAQQQAIDGFKRAFAEWMLVHPEFPAAPEAAAQMVAWCQKTNRGMTFVNCEDSWREMQAAGVLKPDYSSRNRDAVLSNIEELRAQGINIQAPPDPMADREAYEVWQSQQPAENLQAFEPIADTSAWDGPKDYYSQGRPTGIFEDNLSKDWNR